jgi:hypothetical protein
VTGASSSVSLLISESRSRNSQQNRDVSEQAPLGESSGNEFAQRAASSAKESATKAIVAYYIGHVVTWPFPLETWSEIEPETSTAKLVSEVGASEWSSS